MQLKRKNAEAGIDMMNVAKEPLKVNMLGTFSIYNSEKILLEDEGKSRKLWNLLAYIIVNRGRKLSPTELPEILCSDERIDDPVKAVKNLVYRLRLLLINSPMPKFEYIQQSGGIYRWNTEIPMETDIDQIIAMYKAAQREEISQDEAIEKYIKAIDLYKGDFLPRLSYEEWSFTLRVYYHRMYAYCIQELFDILSIKKNVEPMIEICEKAILLDPYDEDIYIIYLKTLIGLNMEKQALKAYEEITERLYTELGINPSKELKQIYGEILKIVKNVEMDLQNIKIDLKEQEFIDGTFCTDYEIFKGIYRFIARSVERSGSSVFVMLYTIADINEKMMKSEILTKNMMKLKAAIKSVLRKGDIFAQYSLSQYIIILPNVSYENGVHIGERILAANNKSSQNKNILLSYKLQPLDPGIVMKV